LARKLNKKNPPTLSNPKSGQTLLEEIPTLQVSTGCILIQ